MTRQLLALLALLSGLAALQAPASASPLETLSSNIQASSNKTSGHRGAVCMCESVAEIGQRTCPQSDTIAALPALSDIELAATLIGVDRALE